MMTGLFFIDQFTVGDIVYHVERRQKVTVTKIKVTKDREGFVTYAYENGRKAGIDRYYEGTDPVIRRDEEGAYFLFNKRGPVV